MVFVVFKVFRVRVVGVWGGGGACFGGSTVFLGGKLVVSRLILVVEW